MKFDKEFALKVLTIFRGKPHNRYTRYLLYLGATLLTPSFIETLIIKFIEETYRTPFYLDDTAFYGLRIILMALIYNLISNLITEYFDSLKPEFTNEELIHRKLDLKLLNEIREILPSDGLIQNIRKLNIAGYSYPHNEFNDFRVFTSKFESPEFHFNDKELESTLSELTSNIDDLINQLARFCYSNSANGFFSIPKEWHHENLEKFNLAVESINPLFDKICELYDKLIYEGRTKLGE